MDPHKVKLLELCHVSPPPNSVPNETSLPLTFYDLPYLLRPPSQLLLFFDLLSPLTSTTHHEYFMDSILPQIKHSLSLTLQHFHPLAGKLSWTPESGKPTISYTNGDSVVVTVAESMNGDFTHLSSYNSRDPNDLNPLIPQLSSPTKQVPVLAIQITLFPSSPAGMSMAIVSHHAVMDGRAAMLFISSWASICRLGGDSSLESLPFYDRSIVKDKYGFENLFLEALVKYIRSKSLSEYDCNNWLFLSRNIITLSDPVSATFQLSMADITKLKQSVLAARVVLINNDNNEEAEGHDHPMPLILDPTRFEVACAYTWVCLTKSNKETANDDDETFVIPAVCNRSRSDPPIPSTYFGTCVVRVKVSGKRSEIVGDDGIAVAVKYIRKQVRGLNEAIVKKSLENQIKPMISHGLEKFGIGGSPQFGVYKFDFGWGKPRKADYASIAVTGAIFFADSRSGDGGIEISLVRCKDEMDAFALSYANGLKNLSPSH